MSDENQKEYPYIGFQPMTCGDKRNVWLYECPQYKGFRVCCLECQDRDSCLDECKEIESNCQMHEYNFIGPSAIRLNTYQEDSKGELKAISIEDIMKLPGPLFCHCHTENGGATIRKWDVLNIMDNPALDNALEFTDVTYITYFSFYDGLKIVWTWCRPESPEEEEETGGIINV